MPANLTPEYRAAEAEFRKARDPGQRLECLREMLRVIPSTRGPTTCKIALLGPPSAGKSSLHERLTGSGAPVAPYRFTTRNVGNTNALRPRSPLLASVP